MRYLIAVVLTAVACMGLSACSSAEPLASPMKGERMSPVVLARIVPDTANTFRAEGVAAARSGDLTLGPDGALAFGKGGRIVWESDRLLSGPRGAIVLEFNYSDKTAYHRDEPVLLVSDAAGQPVLRVTIGRVMFKVARPPEEFAIDLYLNESERSWMRTVIAWERLGDGRVYLRATVNDRPYWRTIAPGFPAGALKFAVGPENVSVREVAFYDAPLPREAFPHICRATQDNPSVEAARRGGFITEAEQSALDARGGVVVYVPEGGLTYCLETGLRTMGLRGVRVVGRQALPKALAKAAVLVLPDIDRWPEEDRLDEAITRYVRGGGGLLAVGKGALEARRLGLCRFDPATAGVDGATQDMFTRRGPFYGPPLLEESTVVMKESLSGLPFAMTTPSGDGRVALTAGMPFGYYFWHPTYEVVGGVGRNAGRYSILKRLLFYAAGITPPAKDATPIQTSVAEDRSALVTGPTRMTKLVTGDSPEALDGAKKLPLGKIVAGGKGAVGFWFRADTLGLAGAEPRSLLLLSDGGENSLHLYYDPCEQFLVLRSATPNEEGLIYANERTTWDGKAWRHIAFTWEATSTGDAAVELFIDGKCAARGGLPLPTRPWDRAQAGACDGMAGLAMSLRELVLVDRAEVDFSAVLSRVAPPISWEDTAEDRARLQQFLKANKLAILGETHPGNWQAYRTYDQYGMIFDVLMEKDLLEGRLEKGGYSVLWAPGGGPPKYGDQLKMRDHIRNVIRGGCGYVGVCAGMIEASSGDPAQKLCLYKTPIVGFGGTQLVDVLLDPAGASLKGVAGAFTDEQGRPAVRFVHMSGLPLRVGEAGADVTAAAYMGMAPTLGAAGSFLYGKGRGFVWMPHPELDGWAWWHPSDRTRYVMRQLLRESIYGVARQ